MECTVKWGGPNGMLFTASTGSGHAVLMDGAPSSGGHNLAPRPMEMVLLGTGGCTAFDIVHILQKARHQILDCQVHLEAERAETDPKVFKKIHFKYTVIGKKIPMQAVERAINLSKEKYCSASAMLAHDAVITTSFEIQEAQ